MVLVGIGAGLSFPALMTLAMSSADPTDAGLASGLVNTTQQVGGALGLAVLATLASTHTQNLLHSGKTSAAALTSGYHLAWAIGTALLVAAVGAALAVLRPAAVTTALEEVDGGARPRRASPALRRGGVAGQQPGAAGSLRRAAARLRRPGPRCPDTRCTGRPTPLHARRSYGPRRARRTARTCSRRNCRRSGRGGSRGSWASRRTGTACRPADRPRGTGRLATREPAGRCSAPSPHRPVLLAVG